MYIYIDLSNETAFFIIIIFLSTVSTTINLNTLLTIYTDKFEWERKDNLKKEKGETFQTKLNTNI